VIPNGPDVSAFTVSTPKPDLRRQNKVAGFTAIYAGAHGPANGLDQLLDAAAQLPNIHFMLVGAGPEKERLRFRAFRERLTNVDFRDPIPKWNLPNLLAACDVGVHVLAPWDSFKQGLSPNKLFDYMAAGIPVVSNCATGIRGVLEDNECGRLGESQELTTCLIGVLNASESQREEWSARGRQIVHDRFSRTAAAIRLRAVLDAAAGTGPAGGEAGWRQ
jgi:glycosyltransferase involved in cell wall biosynthesis